MIKRQIGGLDLVRFFAAMIVAVFHLGYWTEAYPRGQSGQAAHLMPMIPATEPFRHLGWVGVEIFFVISGFVIAFSASGAAPGRFAMSRLLRLVPAVLVIAPISAVAMLAVGAQSPRTVLSNLARSVTFHPFGQWVDSVYWTLGIEIVFYLCIALLLVSRRFDRLVEPFAAAIGFVGLAFWATHTVHPLGSWATSRILSLALVHHGALFATGVFLWAAWQRGPTPARITALVIFSAGSVLEIVGRAAIEAVKVDQVSLWWPAPTIWLAGLVAIICSLRMNFGGAGSVGSV